LWWPADGGALPCTLEDARREELCAAAFPGAFLEFFDCVDGLLRALLSPCSESENDSDPDRDRDGDLDLDSDLDLDPDLDLDLDPAEEEYRDRDDLRVD
jgi:hypothetical protein